MAALQSCSVTVSWPSIVAVAWRPLLIKKEKLTKADFRELFRYMASINWEEFEALS
jgi:hypothetical protein